MKRATTLFGEKERATIAAAVAEAERGTSGEIVPVVATVSGRYDRAEDLFGVATALAAMSAVWIFFQEDRQTVWSSFHVPRVGLPILIVVVAAGFVLGALVATRFPVLRHPFIARREMREEVERRAREAFQRRGIRRTAGATGVLIYVSLYERMVHVVGDEAISAKIPPQDWQAICDRVVEGMRVGDAAAGLEQAIRKAGEILAVQLPIAPGDRNELPNELVLVD